MKVILLAPTPPPAGGIAGWTVRMMNATLKNGWEIAVVDEKIKGNREVFGQGNKRDLVTEWKRCKEIWRNLNRELKSPEAVIVHSCIPSTTFAMMREYICAKITKRNGRKFIMHFRCTVPNTTKGKIGNCVLKMLCKKCDLIIALNYQTLDYLESITQTKVIIIPNFISSDELVNEKEISDEIRTVIYVGGVIEEKGALDMLRVEKEFPRITFKLIGKDDSTIEGMMKSMSLKNVILSGVMSREQIKKELVKADVFMFLSYFSGEGFSNALAEAMAAGLPCIVTEWAANADMIGTDGGIVVPIKSPEAAGEALKLIKSPDARREFSRNNIKKVKVNYAEDIVIEQYINEYEGILKGE